MKLSDIDWKNVDRDKIKFDHGQFANIDRNSIRDRVKLNGENRFKSKADGLRDRRLSARRERPKVSVSDIRKTKISHLDRSKISAHRPSGRRPEKIGHRAGNGGLPVPVRRPEAKPHAPISHAASKRDFKRPAGKPRPGGFADARPKRPTAIGNMESGRRAKLHSNRGHKTIGGGHHAGGGGHRAIKHGGRLHHR
jgi:hypothetical protein